MQVQNISDDESINLALDTIKIKKQCIIFCNARRSAEKTAEDLSKKIKESFPMLEELSNQILNILPKPTTQCQRLAKCVKKGIAFHHSGLIQEQKQLITDAFRNGIIKVICCTPTLAAGVDLPAYRVILINEFHWSLTSG